EHLQGARDIFGQFPEPDKTYLRIILEFSVLQSDCSSPSEELKSTIETNDGGFLLSGTSNSTISGDKTENSNGGNDFWVIKTNSLGTIVWQNTIGGNLSDEPVSAIQTNDGGYLIAGSSNSSLSGDKTENSKGGFDYWIVKLDSNGNVIWDKTIGGNLDDKIAKIIPTSDGNYVLIGSSKSTISGNKTESNRGEFDIWMLKINSSGSILWDKTIGGNLDDNAYDVIQSSDNGYLIGATSTSTISGDKTENNRGNKDYWAVKLEADNLSIPENNSLSTILLYPNPTDGIITIDFGAFQETVSISTLNVLGQLISKHNFNQISEKQLQIDEPSGVYFLEIENGNQDKKVFKIVKN
ncbi:MAG: T9SS type A sorting domain-containing protein, partial [Flavobacteriaceae bacterium]|nr:T9SS type A sorting domain-containing protein [Flavobacteriaceae bacterium]